MRRVAVACLVGGLLLTAWLVFAVGGPALLAGLRTAGWRGLLAISAFHLVVTTLMGLAWWGLQGTGKFWFYIWGRLLRDAGSEVLPLSQIGGYVLGARAPILHGVGRTTVAASVVVDATLEFCAQLAYIALGAALVLRLSLAPTLAASALLAVVLAIAAVIMLVAARTRDSDLPARVAMRFLRGRLGALSAAAAAVQSEIRSICLSKHRLWQGFLLHLAAWMVTGVEAWLTLRLLGVPRALTVVLAIEGLLYATRAMAFMVPNAIGVQEGAYMLLGATLGLPPEAALGLSLLKRARDLVLGVPTLVTWQLLEWRRDGGSAGEALRSK